MQNNSARLENNTTTTREGVVVGANYGRTAVVDDLRGPKHYQLLDVNPAGFYRTSTTSLSVDELAAISPTKRRLRITLMHA